MAFIGSATGAGRGAGIGPATQSTESWARHMTDG